MRRAICSLCLGIAVAPLSIWAEPAPDSAAASPMPSQSVARIAVAPDALGRIVGTVAARQAGFPKDAGAPAKGYAFDVARAYPALTVTERHVSNLHYAPGNRTPSYIATVSPEVQLARNLGTGAGALTYVAEFGFASYDSRDGYSDHLVSADYRYDNSFSALALTMALERGHEDRGEGLSEGIALTLAEPHEYELTGFASTIELGPEDERVGVMVDIGLAKLDYVNDAAATRAHDRDTRRIATRVFMGISPGIRFFGEYGRKSIDYDVLPVGGSSFDSDENSLAAGFAWNFGDAASGEFRYGTLAKSFNQSARTEKDLKIWSGSLRWQSAGLRLGVEASNRPEETFNSGDFLEVTDIRVTLVQRLTEHLGVDLYARKGNSNHVGAPRSDDLRDFGLALSWRAPARFGARLFYERRQRDSNQHLFDFKRVEWGISFSARM